MAVKFVKPPHEGPELRLRDLSAGDTFVWDDKDDPFPVPLQVVQENESNDIPTDCDHRWIVEMQSGLIFFERADAKVRRVSVTATWEYT